MTLEPFLKMKSIFREERDVLIILFGLINNFKAAGWYFWIKSLWDNSLSLSFFLNLGIFKTPNNVVLIYEYIWGN